MQFIQLSTLLSQILWLHQLFRTTAYLFCHNRLDEQVSNQLAKSHLEDSGSLVEIYDIKLSVKNIGKLDLRAKFTDGKPAVVSVKVDEQKVVTFDILCLHR